MDNGEVIPGLNESWTLGGAKLMEWMSGFMAFIIFQELFLTGNAGKNMPILLLVWIGTTFTLAGLRRKFPDEERGVANLVALHCGVNPPGLPAPSQLQPFWSGSPVREYDEKKEYVQLGLEEALFAHDEDEEQG